MSTGQEESVVQTNESDQSTGFAVQPGDVESGSANIGSSAPTDAQAVCENGPQSYGGAAKDDKSLKFFVGGIHPEAWDEDVLKYFQRFGRVKDVQVMKDHSTGRNRGFGFVTMEDSSAKDQIFCPTAEHIIKAKKVDVRFMQPEGHSNVNRKIFVGGINPALGEEVLHKYFKQFGDIEKVTIMRDMDGRSRGFGFVVYTAENVVKLVLAKRQHNVTTADKVEVRRAEARNRAAARPMSGGGMYPGAAGGYEACRGGAAYGPGRGDFPGPGYDPRGGGAAAGYYDMGGMGYDSYGADAYHQQGPYVGYDWSYDPSVMGYNYYSPARQAPSSPLPASAMPMYGGSAAPQQQVPSYGMPAGVGRGAPTNARGGSGVYCGSGGTAPDSFAAPGASYGGASYGAGGPPVAGGYGGGPQSYAAARVGRGGFRAAPY